MKRIFKYFSYALIYLVISIASAYGVINLSLNISLNHQTKGSGSSGGGTEITLPAQLTSIIDSMGSTKYLDLNLSADIDYMSNSYLVEVNAVADLSNGISNLAAEGNINAKLTNNNLAYSVDFAYNNNNFYADMLGGKMLMQTSSIMTPISQILTMLNIKLPNIDLADMDISSMLGLFSNLTEEKLEDSEDFKITIALPVIEKDLILICDENYFIKSIACDIELDNFKVSLSGNINYPETVSFKTYNDEEYVDIGNLLSVAESTVRYVTENENYAFKLTTNALNSPLVGMLFIDAADGSAKFSMNVDKQELNIIFQKENVYIEFGNIFAKFNLQDLDKVNEFLNNSFGLNLPLAEIKDMVNSLMSGNILGSISGLDIDKIINTDLNNIDLSILEKVYIENNTTYAQVRNIGTFAFTANNDTLSAISFTRENIEVKLETISYKQVELITSQENYINLVSFLPTAENVIAMMRDKALIGNLNVSFDKYNLPVNLLVDLKNNYFKVSLALLDNNIEIEMLNDKIYMNLADTLKILVDTKTLQESLIKFFSEIDYEADISGLVNIVGGLKEIINPSVNPALIKALTQTENGFTLTLYNDLIITLINGSNEINISTGYDKIQIDLTLIGSNEVVNIPTFDDAEYDNVQSILDLAKAFINSGMLNVVEGTVNYFKDGKAAFDLSLNYDKLNVSGKVYADILSKKANLQLSYDKHQINLNLIDEVIYLEYSNIYAKFALRDLPTLIEMLNTQFNLNLPLEFISNVFNAVNTGDLEGAYNILSQKLPQVNKLEISKIDLSFFDKIIVNGNDTIIPVQDNLITITIVEKMLTAIKFNGFGANVTANTIEYVDNDLAVDQESYIDLTILIPTIDNVISVVRNNTLSGQININYDKLNLVANYTISKADEIYVNISTTIKDMLIEISYLNGKVYFNADNKLMLVCVVNDLPTAIKQFIQDINLDVDTKDISNKIVEALTCAIDPVVNPALIKALTQTENGFTLTLYNDLIITLVNGSNEINISTGYDKIQIDLTLIGSNEVVNIPTFDDAEYDNVQSILDLAKAFINSGMLNVVEGTINYFKDGKAAFDLSLSYDRFNVSGKVYADILNKKVNLQLSYDKHQINLNLIDEVVYLEYSNIYAKFALRDLPNLINMLNTQFNLNLPLEFISNVFNAVNAGDLEGAYNILAEKLPQDNKFEISKIDLSFFDKITVNGNDTIIPVQDNLITITIVEKMLTGIKFNGFGARVTANTIEYIDNDLAVDQESYIDLTILIPTIDNVINMVETKMLSGHFDINLGNAQIPVDIEIAFEESLYVKIDAVLLKTHLYIYYYDNLVFVNYGDIKLKTDLQKLPELVKELSKDIDTLIDPILGLLGINKQELETTGDLLDGSNSTPLFTSLNKTPLNDGFILTLANNMEIIVTNETSKVNLAIVSGNISLNGYIKVANVVRQIIDDTNYAQIDDVFKLIDAAKNMSKETDFHINGTVELKILGISMGNIPIDIYIKVVNKQIQLAIEMSLPDNLNLGNLVGFDIVNTKAYDRKVKIFYRDGNVYIYRTEQVKSGSSKVPHEVCTKVTLEEFMSNPIEYVKFAFDFTQKIIDMMMQETDHGRDSTDNENYEMFFERIFKVFKVSQENESRTKYELTVNLAELTDNANLGDFIIYLYVDEDAENKNYLKELYIDVTVVNVIKLVTSKNSITIDGYGKDYQIPENTFDYVDDYIFDFDAQMERTGGQGNWDKVSEKVYSLNFVSEGETISTITGAFQSEFILPTLSNQNFDSENLDKNITKTFVGWYASENFEEESLFNQNTMPNENLTLYAKWDITEKYYHTINFVTNSDDIIEPIKVLTDSSLNLPILSIKQEYDENGLVKGVQSFDGWFLDENLNEEFNFSMMPDRDIALYAKWVDADLENCKLFALYDGEQLLYTRYIIAGEEVDLSKIAKVNDTTKFYRDANFNDEFTEINSSTNNIVMPNYDLTLYVRNSYTLNIVSEYGNVVNEAITIWQGSTFSLPSQVSYSEDNDLGTKCTIYTFNGYYLDGNSFESCVMPNKDITIVADWTRDIKNYYTVSFVMDWYKVDGCGLINSMKEPPAAIEPLKLLEGSVLDLTQYQPTCRAQKKVSTIRTYKATSWGTSAWGSGTKAGSGFTSITITSDTTLYACWEEQA